MKIAIIDLGTNTFHLLIAEIETGEPKIIFKTNEPVRLGEDITKANLIIPKAYARGINCLIEFKSKIDHYGVAMVKAVATSGIRSAANGPNFVKDANDIAGIKVDIIDGDEEANYIYEGVKWSGAITETALIMDIGGGSTEFILCNPERLIWKKSYNIGAARLMQEFFKSDPINDLDQLTIKKYLEKQLKELLAACKTHQPQILIGSAGAFESFAGMINSNLDLKKISTANINFDAYKELSLTLIKANHNERANMNGLIPLRIDMIVMATILTNYILEKTAIKQIILSTYDLKMGVLKSL